MKQSDTEGELAALADGSLEGSRKDKLLERIEEDVDLARYLARQRSVVEPVRAVTDPAPVSLQRRIAAITELPEPRRIRRSPALLAGALVAVCAIAAGIVLGLSGAHPASPSLPAVAALTSKPAEFPAPAQSKTHSSQLDASVEGVAFPYWEDRYGWRASGSRVDRIAGRLVRTVFYTARDGRRIGYAIVSGSPLSVTGGTVIRRSDGSYRLLRADVSNVVAWVEAGHSCVLSGVGVKGATLLRLAS